MVRNKDNRRSADIQPHMHRPFKLNYIIIAIVTIIARLYANYPICYFECRIAGSEISEFQINKEFLIDIIHLPFEYKDPVC
jgi:hypothetical protein